MVFGMIPGVGQKGFHASLVCRVLHLLYARQHPAACARHRFCQVPDFLERFGLRIGALADHAGETHAGPVGVAFGERFQQFRVERHHVGLLPDGAVLQQVLLDRFEHRVGGEFAQLAQLAAVMHGLQLDEIELGLAQESLGVEAGGDVGLRRRAEGRLGAEPGRRGGDGLLAHAGKLQIAFGLGPGEQAHDKDYGETDQGHHQQSAHHASQATLAEQPAQAQAGGEAGDRTQPAVARRLGRCGGSGSCSLRRRGLLHAPVRGHAALRTQAPASAQTRGLGVRNHQAQCQKCGDSNR